MPVNERGQRAKTNKETRRKDIENASTKATWCPTCGQKMPTGSASVGGSAGGGG